MKKTLNTSVLVTADSPEGQKAAKMFDTQYNKAELDLESAQTLNEDPNFEDWLLGGIKRFSKKSSRQQSTRIILEKDFVSVERTMGLHKGIVYTEEQLSHFVDTFPSQKALEWCHENGHMLVPGPNYPMSFLEVRDLMSEYFYISNFGTAYERQPFAKIDKVKTDWIMLRKGAVPGSVSQTWRKQNSLLSEDDEVPNAAEVAWCLAIYKAVRQNSLLPNTFVRTSSCNLLGHHVYVGVSHNLSEEGKIVAFSATDEECKSYLGLASKRKR